MPSSQDTSTMRLPGVMLVGHAEMLTVTTLKVDAIPKVSGDPLDVQRMNREPPLALLPRPRNHSQAKPCYVPWCADDIHGITYCSYRQLAGSARQRMRPVVTSGGSGHPPGPSPPHARIAA